MLIDYADCFGSRELFFFFFTMRMSATSGSWRCQDSAYHPSLFMNLTKSLGLTLPSDHANVAVQHRCAFFAWNSHCDSCFSDQCQGIGYRTDARPRLLKSSGNDCSCIIALFTWSWDYAYSGNQWFGGSPQGALIWGKASCWNWMNHWAKTKI